MVTGKAAGPERRFAVTEVTGGFEVTSYVAERDQAVGVVDPAEPTGTPQ